MEYSFLTWNIWFETFFLEERTKKIMFNIQQKNIDFVALQEVTEQSLDVIKKYKKDYYLIGDPITFSYDTIILSKYKPIKWERINFPNSVMGRNLLIADFPNNISVGTFHLESIFTKDSYTEKLAQLDYISKVCSKKENVVFMGDTNFTIKNREIELTEPFADAFEMASSPYGYEITYSGKYNSNIKNKYFNSRLDRIYCNKEKWGIKEFRLFGTHRTVFTGDMSINPSDHYGVYSTLYLRDR